MEKWCHTRVIDTWMNDEMREKQINSPIARKSDRSWGSSSHFWRLTLGRQLGSWEPWFLHHSLERDSLLQKASVSAVKSSITWTRPTYTKLSPLPQSPLTVSRRTPGNLVFHWIPECQSAGVPCCVVTARSPWQQSPFRIFASQGMFAAGLF